jgi:sterol desaturase/sphingolipid hydroxylase (fatty acid hydroxylase superfamily)
MNQYKQSTKCNLVIAFIIQKFIEVSTCFERHTVYHQLQTLFATSGLYIHVVTGLCPGWVGQRPVTTWVFKPAARTV